jgi:hypothetical protein
MDAFISTIMEAGFSGVTNVPTAGIYDGNFRRQIDSTGLGYPKEIDLVSKCRKRDIFTIAYAFNEDEARAMADAGADIIGLMSASRSVAWLDPVTQLISRRLACGRERSGAPPLRRVPMSSSLLMVARSKILKASRLAMTK